MSTELDAWNNLKEKIRLIPISAIIGKYITLTKKGQNYEAICPFHRDTHPSLKVSDQKNLYKCFACNVAGDSLKFVMDFKKIGFKEAVEVIAKENGLNIPTSSKKINPKVQRFLDCHQIVWQFYWDLTNKEFQSEMLSFCKNRKISEETLQKFKICYAPEGRHLADHLLGLKEKYNSPFYDCALELGLIKMGDHGHYDTFRRRILFPIHNGLGQIVGFGSRATAEGQMPKYLNSQDSLIFNKRHILYGLPLARTKIRERSSVFIVEGYMDAIMMHQAGFEQTVAVMGVALTEDHFKDLNLGIKNYYLLLDQDQAGEIAAKRSLPLFLKNKFLPLRIDLLDCKDPDEFIKNNGQLEFNNQVSKAKGWLDFLLDRVAEVATGDNVDAKLKLLVDAFELVKPLETNLEAIERIISFSKKIGLNSPETSLVEQYQSFLKNNNHVMSHQQANKIEQQPITTTANTEQKPIEKIENVANLVPIIENKKEINKAELFLIKELLKNPELLRLQNFTEVIEFVTNNEVKEFVLFIPKILAEVDLSDFAQTTMSLITEKGYSEKIKQIACDVFFQWNPPLHQDEAILKKQFLDIRKKTFIETLKNEKMELRKKHLDSKTQEELHEILKKVHEIDKKIFEMKTSERSSEIQKG